MKCDSMRRAISVRRLIGAEIRELNIDAEIRALDQRNRLLQSVPVFARHPNDFWLNLLLGHALWRGRRPEEAVGFYRAALAVREDNERAARLYRRLGYTDWGHGRLVCFADVMCPGGRPGVAPELCHVLVRQFDYSSLRVPRTFSSSAPG